MQDLDAPTSVILHTENNDWFIVNWLLRSKPSEIPLTCHKFLSVLLMSEVEDRSNVTYIFPCRGCCPSCPAPGSWATYPRHPSVFRYCPFCSSSCEIASTDTGSVVHQLHLRLPLGWPFFFLCALYSPELSRDFFHNKIFVGPRSKPQSSFIGNQLHNVVTIEPGTAQEFSTDFFHINNTYTVDQGLDHGPFLLLYRFLWICPLVGRRHNICGLGINVSSVKKTDLGSVQQFKAQRSKLKVTTCPNMGKNGAIHLVKWTKYELFFLPWKAYLDSVNYFGKFEAQRTVQYIIQIHVW